MMHPSIAVITSVVVACTKLGGEGGTHPILEGLYRKQKANLDRTTTAIPTRETGLTLVRNCCSVLWDYFRNGTIRKRETLIPYAQLFLPIRIKNFFLRFLSKKTIK